MSEYQYFTHGDAITHRCNDIPWTIENGIKYKKISKERMEIEFEKMYPKEKPEERGDKE